jgi:hypothetical protein
LQHTFDDPGVEYPYLAQGRLLDYLAIELIELLDPALVNIVVVAHDRFPQVIWMFPVRFGKVYPLRDDDGRPGDSHIGFPALVCALAWQHRIQQRMKQQ